MSVKKFLKTAQELQAQAEAARPKSESKPKVGEEESGWLVSYADMMTLLCGFFIMLFSMAKMDEPKYEKVKEAMSKQFGGEYTSPSQELAQFMTATLEQAGPHTKSSMKVDSSGVTLIFESTLFFDTLSAEVKPEGRAVLKHVISRLAEHQKAQPLKAPYQIVVEGHTDSRPILAGSFPSNWELSGARASRVIRMFLDEKFAPDKLTAIGYGDTRPQVPSRTPSGAWDEEGLQKNRRVVLRILNPQVDAIPFPNTNLDASLQPPASTVAAAVAAGAGAVTPIASPQEQLQQQRHAADSSRVEKIVAAVKKLTAPRASSTAPSTRMPASTP